MRNVLIIMSTLGMGGAEKSLISMLNTIDPAFLNENGISIDILIADTTGVLYRQIPSYIRIIHCPWLFKILASPKENALKNSRSKVGTLVLKAFWKFSSLMIHEPLYEIEKYWKANKTFIPRLKGEYDVCLAYMNGLTTYYAIDKVTANKKYVWVHTDYNKLMCSDGFNKAYFEKADGIITISQKCAENIVEHFPQLKGTIQVIENISSGELIRQQADMFFPNEYRSTDSIRIVSVGRLNVNKGFDVGIEAARILADRGRCFDWFLVGEGEERASLESSIRKNKLENRVHLLGMRENPYPYVKNADIYFQPSRNEGKSIALDEAKILFRPIVAANYATVHDAIISGVDGLICELTPQALADGLETLMENKKLAEDFQFRLQSSEQGNSGEIQKYYGLMLS